jgi:hypothetical protein
MMSNSTLETRPPSDINLNLVAMVLSGEVHELASAFSWHKTPQGNLFWHSQYIDKKLTEEGRAILELWLNTETPGIKPSINSGPHDV